MILIQLSFDFTPSMMGEELVKVGKDLADSINNEAGFISKIWTENPETGKAGGIYLFEDKETAENYMDMHAKRIQSLGIEKFDVQYFSVNEKPYFIIKKTFLEILRRFFCIGFKFFLVS